MKLKNVSIYNDNEKLYFYYDDGKLFSIEGEHKEIVCRVIKEIKNNNPKEIEHFKVDADKNIVKEILAWLISLNIIEKENSVINKNILLIGNFSKSFSPKYISEIYNRNDCNINYTIINHISYADGLKKYESNVDIVIVGGIILNHREEIFKLNSFFYEKNKILLHIGLGENHIDLGPLCHKELDTPCLESYIKRKIVNLKEPDTFLKISKLDTLDELNLNRIDCNKLFPLSLELSKIELENYLNTGYSAIVGRSITYDVFRGEVYKSKILPVHNLSYKKENYIAPFN